MKLYTIILLLLLASCRSNLEKNAMPIESYDSGYMDKASIEKEQENILKSVRRDYSNKEYFRCVLEINAFLADKKYSNDFLFELMRIKAKSLFPLQKYDECIALVNTLLQQFPQDQELYLIRADSYQYLKQYKSALDDYTYLIDSFKSIEGYNRRISLYIRGENYLLADIDADSLLKLDSLNWQAINNKGIIRVRRGEYINGLIYYKKALAINKFKIIYFNIGEVYYKMNKPDSACYYYKISADLGYKEGLEYYNTKCKKSK